jgi:hypothetical protein
MTTINLEKFCDPCRYGLDRPFSIGPWSYASNGHVLVRVPRRSDIAECKAAPDAAALFSEYAAQPAYKPAPKFEIAPEETCNRCGGTGLKHDCPDCACECRACDGEGVTKQPVDIDGVPFAARYVEWLLDLPDLEITVARPAKPLAFRFAGGEGLLMPRKK